MSEEMFNNEQEQHNAVNRYEEMLRNHGNYFFDTFAFENIIDYYIEKDNSLKALQVTKFAINQHPYFSTFLIQQAQLDISLSKKFLSNNLSISLYHNDIFNTNYRSITAIDSGYIYNNKYDSRRIGFSLSYKLPSKNIKEEKIPKNNTEIYPL